MTARELVERLLNEADSADSPKKWVRRLQQQAKRIPRPEEVDYDIELEWEQDPPEDSFTFPEDIARVREEIENGNIWGWCQVHVIARWTDSEDNTYEGDDYLGGCSYRDKADFIRSDYYTDMKAVAYDALVKELEKAGFR